MPESCFQFIFRFKVFLRCLILNFEKMRRIENSFIRKIFSNSKKLEIVFRKMKIYKDCSLFYFIELVLIHSKHLSACYYGYVIIYNVEFSIRYVILICWPNATRRTGATLNSTPIFLSKELNVLIFKINKYIIIKFTKFLIF